MSETDTHIQGGLREGDGILDAITQMKEAADKLAKPYKAFMGED